MWHLQNTVRVVARYAHLLDKVSDPDTDEKLVKVLFGEVRQLEDRLGLSPLAMLRLRWEVDPTATEAPAVTTTVDEVGAARVRRQLKKEAS
jgi:hypothetical protein